jgi:hypothetical protein
MHSRPLPKLLVSIILGQSRINIAFIHSVTTPLITTQMLPHDNMLVRVRNHMPMVDSTHVSGTVLQYVSVRIDHYVFVLDDMVVLRRVAVLDDVTMLINHYMVVLLHYMVGLLHYMVVGVHYCVVVIFHVCFASGYGACLQRVTAYLNGFVRRPAHMERAALIFIPMCVCVCVCIRTYVCVCMYVCEYVCMCVFAASDSIFERLRETARARGTCSARIRTCVYVCV